jgi:hypothetical protein
MGRDVAEGIAAKEQRRRKPNILASPDFGHWALIPQSGFQGNARATLGRQIAKNVRHGGE